MQMYSYKDDKHYAEDVCRESKPARDKFIPQYYDTTYWIAKKWHGSKNYNNFFEIPLISGELKKADDEILDTMTWLLKKAISATCKYKGSNDSSLDTYINSVISGQWTFNDWLKRKYGNTDYLPKFLKNEKEVYQKVFTALRRKKEEALIAKEVNLSLDEVQNIISELKFKLYKKGKGHLLGNKLVQIDPTNNEGETIDVGDMEDDNVLDPSSISEVNQILIELKKIYNQLDKTDKRLLGLYWGEGLSVSKILDYIKYEDILDDFKNLEIHDDKDFYQHITMICKTCEKMIINNNVDFYNLYNLNISKIKNGLKVIINDFDLN